MDYQYNYQRYLASKKQIDDLALNKRVLDTLSEKLDLTIFRGQKEYFMSFKNGKTTRPINFVIPF